MTRVRYAEGQRLRAGDLTAEQEYLVELERRHNTTQHGPGIVHGLDRGEDWRNQPIVRAGVAVDPEGHVLVLEDETILDGAQRSLWLIPCDAKVRVRSCRSDRVREDVRLVSLPAEDGAPADGAIYLGPDRPQYTSLTESQVNDPAIRAAMQVGPAHGRDRNGFLITTGGQPRIAIDRLGTNSFFGNVEESGYLASATLTLSQTTTLLMVARQPGSAGERVHVQIRPEQPQAGQRQLRIRFFEGSKKTGADLVLAQSPESWKAAVDAYESDLVEVSLKGTVPRNVRRSSENEAQAVARDPFQTALDLTLKTRGGRVDLEASVVEEDPNGLSFVAMKEAPQAPPQPGLWSVNDELRLDLGEKKDNDVSVRFALSELDANGKYAEWLKLRGDGRLIVSGDVDVAGTIEFKPIQPDHTDPNFTNLLVRAWLDGLQAAIEASTVVAVSFANLPALVKTGEAWSYDVTITNNSQVAVVADRILETRTITGQPAPLSKFISQQVTIDALSSKSVTVQHTAGDTPAGMMTIEARVSGKIGNAAWWKSNTTVNPIPVVASPAIDLAGIPDSVPRNTPWTHSFDVVNNADRAVTLDSVTVKENAGAPQPQPGLPAPLGANQTRTFGPTPHAGINASLDITVAAHFTWEDGSTTQITAPVKRVRARNDLTTSISVAVEPQQQTAWSYNLRLTNVSGRALTLAAVRQRVVSPAAQFPPGPWEAIPALAGKVLALDADDVEPVDAPLVPAPAAAGDEIDLELELDYTREDTLAFTIAAARRGIDVV